MDKIAAFYEANNLLVLVVVIILFLIYIKFKKNKKSDIIKYENKIETFEGPKSTHISTDENVITQPFNKTKEIMKAKQEIIVSNYFFIKRNKLGKNLIIKFKDGNGTIWYYDHNLVYKKLQNRFDNMPCFITKNAYTSTDSVPSYVRALGTDFIDTNPPSEITNQSKLQNQGINIRTFEYTSTRFSFKKTIIDQMNDNDVLIINVKGSQNRNNEGIFKMSKLQIYRTYPNVINSVAYRRDGNYNYQKTPETANQFRI